MPQIYFIYRAKGKGVSIERLFKDIRGKLSKRYSQKSFHVPCTGATNPISILRNLWTTYRQKADIYHITGDVQYVAASLPGSRSILTVHDLHFLEWDLEKKPFRRFIYKSFWVKMPVRRCTTVVAISDFTKEAILRHTGVPEKKITVIPDCFSDAFHHVEKPFPPTKPILLIVGTGVNKNVPRMVRACQGLDVHLRIIGRMREEMKEALQDSGCEYSQVANISDDQIVREYQQCDILLFASLREGFGMPILEAQATGRPVLTSTLRPMTDITGNAAVHVDATQVSAIRDGILSLLENAELRQQLIRKGLQNAQHYTSTQVSQQYTQLYNQLLEN